MRKLLKIIGISLLASMTLTSCVSTKFHSQTIQERVYSIAYDSQNKNAYIIGEKYDYQLDVCKVAYTENQGYQYCLNNIEFLQDRHSQKKIENIAIEQISLHENQMGKNTNNHLTGTYAMYLPLSHQDYQELKGQSLAIYPVQSHELTTYNQTYGKNHNENQLYRMPIHFSGKAVILQNKNEILTKGKLKQPLAFEMRYNTVTPYRSATPIAKGALAAVLAPVGFVIMLPFGLVMAMNGV